MMRGTYDSHVVETDGSAIHADSEEGHEGTHVEPRAGQTLEYGARVGLERTLALRHSVPIRKSNTPEATRKATPMSVIPFYYDPNDDGRMAKAQRSAQTRCDRRRAIQG
jgi:hypothetical protein